MQTLETFSVITVQVRIFSGLDRNNLMYSLRICEILLFMNAKVLFLVICLVSAILYVTRHLVIYEGLCLIFGRSRHEKKKKKQNLTRCPHGPSNKLESARRVSDYSVCLLSYTGLRKSIWTSQGNTKLFSK